MQYNEVESWQRIWEAIETLEKAFEKLKIEVEKIKLELQKISNREVNSEEMDFCPRCGHELVDSFYFAVMDNDYDFERDRLYVTVECPNCNAKILQEWKWVGRKLKQ
jgi:DNA-directed RNA polymerase subunit RPC12/RpoP